jgi:hypothetical protein
LVTIIDYGSSLALPRTAANGTVVPEKHKEFAALMIETTEKLGRALEVSLYKLPSNGQALLRGNLRE